jgi:hypothetical protein
VDVQGAHEKADLVAVAVVAAAVVVAPAAVAAVAGADFPAEPSRDPPSLLAFVRL